jgi:hypothetical protein
MRQPTGGKSPHLRLAELKAVICCYQGTNSVILERYPDVRSAGLILPSTMLRMELGPPQPRSVFRLRLVPCTSS